MESLLKNLEKASLFTVSEPLDRPVKELTQNETAVEILFNPTSLKVALANVLGENERSGNSRAAQYIDKSSSTLTVELIFDTTDQYKQGQEQTRSQVDVRKYTKAIAENFMQPEDLGNENVAPQRCLFAWGTFAFVGIMETFDETLDFFSPDGTPLRATVALKLKESRFEFRTDEAKAAQKSPPADEKNWRDTNMYNGKESPRQTSTSPTALPDLSATASLKVSAGMGAGISGGFSAGISASGGLGLSGGINAGGSAGLSTGLSGGLGGELGGDFGASASGSLGGDMSLSANITPPTFNYGASASLGTAIPGAFSADFQSSGGISAGSLATSSLSGEINTNVNAQASSSLGFD